MLEQLFSPVQTPGIVASQAALQGGERQSLPKSGVFPGIFASLLKLEEKPASSPLLVNDRLQQAASAVPQGVLPFDFSVVDANIGENVPMMPMLSEPLLSARDDGVTDGDMAVLAPVPLLDLPQSAIKSGSDIQIPVGFAQGLPEQAVANSRAESGWWANERASSIPVVVENLPEEPIAASTEVPTMLTPVSPASEDSVVKQMAELSEGRVEADAEWEINDARTQVAMLPGNLPEAGEDDDIGMKTADLLESDVFEKKQINASGTVKSDGSNIAQNARNVDGNLNVDKSGELSPASSPEMGADIDSAVKEEVSQKPVMTVHSGVAQSPVVEKEKTAVAPVELQTPADRKDSDIALAEQQRAEFVHKPGAVLTQSEGAQSRQVETPQPAHTATRMGSVQENGAQGQAASGQQHSGQQHSGQQYSGQQSQGQQSQGQATQQQFMQMAQAAAQEVQVSRQQNSLNLQQAQKTEVTQQIQVDAQKASEESLMTAPAERRGQLPQGLQSIGLPVAHPRWGQALGQRVVYMANNQVQQAQITLNPEKLGPVQIKLHLDKEQQVHVVMTAQQGVTREAMEAAMPRLKELMEQAGIDLGSVNVNQDQREFAQQQEQQGRGRAVGGPSNALQDEMDLTETHSTTVYATDNLVDYYA
jgi:flagellar hook-length control protein FliK